MSGHSQAGRRAYALQDLSHAQFAARLADRPVIALPLGSQEEQGPHAPMGDYVAAERIAMAACEAANAICAPVLPFGYAEFFRGFPGGMQLRGNTFRAVLRDMIDSFIDHGIDRVVIVNGHSTNAPLIAEVAHAVRRETGVLVPAIHLWRSLPDAIWESAHGANATAARGHGADPVTSVMMHLAPELVDLTQGSPAARKAVFGLPSEPHFASARFGSVSVDLPLDATEVADNGIGSGDPSLSTARAGALFTEFLIAHVADFLTYFAACDPRRPETAPAGIAP
ncbi:creatininase (creatinine amidohydrolase) protein [Novosphingobium sp. Rr 2-17]|uniref:creatininase family protein n=1 Tax=Novosphingobium sp. Rr 2-17 TaxID=555793 RepID=UPI000269A89F|nr:creatininase family protein [Novosphingobium sp. Rr 2-17]EIZ77232.1 creatininase (creatinine amidohydrolase) protein [Novosphingobium sp. Rr 2-17]